MTAEDYQAEQIELEPDLPPGHEPPDGESSRRYVKKTGALQQGTNIPTGWRPTVAKPIPVVRCIHIFHDKHERAGERCGRWSMRGTQRCYTHGGKGNLKNVEEHRRAILDAARLQLLDSVPDAMEWLVDLGAHSNADNVRLKAATEILDRAGIRGGIEISADVQVTDVTPAAALAERLGKLKAAADEVARREREEAAALTAAAAETPDTIDGVVVSDTADGEIVDE